MNEIQIINKGEMQVVSSREVAKNFGKDHDKVVNAIEILISQELATLNSMYFESVYYDSRNREQKEYLMTKNGFSLLAMGFTGKKALEWKLKYITLFEKMEKALREQNQIQAPKNYKEALYQLLAAEEEKERLIEENKIKDEVIQIQAPKVDAYDSFLSTKGKYNMGEVAKIFGIKGLGRNNMFEYLRNKKILNRGNTPMQTYIDRGYFEVITETNNYYAPTVTLVTPKGIDWLYKVLTKDGYIIGKTKEEIHRALKDEEEFDYTILELPITNSRVINI